jgi:hypothetical protein
MAMSLALGAGILTFLSSLTRPEAAGRPARRHRRPAVRTVCVRCARRRALLRSHGVVTWGPYHTVCRKHYEACGTRHGLNPAGTSSSPARR